MTRLTALTWNVLVGGEERFPRILELLAARRPDLVCLQECLGWEDGARLAAVAAACGIPADPAHAHLGRARPRPSGRRYHVALLSRWPLLRVVDHADPARVGHCLVEAALAPGGAPLTVFGAHLDAHGEDLRLTEVRHLAGRLAADAMTRERLLLLGDLNALSPRDPYPADLAARLLAAGSDKYGHPPRFEVIPALEARGWVDALRARPAAPAWATARRDRGGVTIDFRTDYVFASPPLAAGLEAVEVLASGGASDHEPVLAAFSL